MVVDWYFPVVLIILTYFMSRVSVFIQQVQSYRKAGLYLAVMHLERFPVIPSPKLHLLIIYKKHHLAVHSRYLHKCIVFF
jgi:hypothetical protein